MKLRNQNGAALVIVLLMITVFFVLGLSLLSSSLSNTKQVNKTEKEMQALDLAEMGVLHYQNHFKENVFKYLENPLKSAINNSDLKTTNDKLTAISQSINRSALKEILKTLPDGPIHDSAEYHVLIQEPDILFSKNNKIFVTISSTGRIHSDTEETIDATVELDIQQLISSFQQKERKPDDIVQIFPSVTNWLTCAKMSECSSDSEGNADFAKVTGGIKDVNIAIFGNSNLSKVSGGVKNSKIYIQGNTDFADMIAGGIKENSTIYVGGNASFTSIPSGVDDTSKICIRGSMNFAETMSDKKVVRIYSYLADSKSYSEAGCPQITIHDDEPSSLDPALISKYTRINNITYH